MVSPVHVAIVRRARPEHAADFERALLEFFEETMSLPGVLGAQIVRQSHRSGRCEFGILRTFTSPEARDAFYASELFAAWQEKVAPMLEEDGVYERRELHGLEAFFQNGGAPPRWKMAFVTWLGVFPTVTFWSALLREPLSVFPSLVSGALFTGAVVITLAWGVMPVLTQWLNPWLHAKAPETSPLS